MEFDRKALRRLRIEKNLGQSELGAMAGCSGNTISIYERGDMIPRERRILKIAKALGVDVSELQKPDQPSNAVMIELLEIIESMCPADRAEMLSLALRIEGRRQNEEPHQQDESQQKEIVDPKFEKYLGVNKKKNQVG